MKSNQNQTNFISLHSWIKYSRDKNGLHSFHIRPIRDDGSLQSLNTTNNLLKLNKNCTCTFKYDVQKLLVIFHGQIQIPLIKLKNDECVGKIVPIVIGTVSSIYSLFPVDQKLLKTIVHGKYWPKVGILLSNKKSIDWTLQETNWHLQNVHPLSYFVKLSTTTLHQIEII